MRIFLSHANEDKAVAESIAFSLRNRGHEVFLDRDDLPPGASYDQRIERAVKDSEIFIFLISPDSIADGRYTLTELSFARRKWKDPSGRLLPVMARKTPIDQIPSYLKAITILEPLGNVTAETSAAVDDLGRSSYARKVASQFAAVGAIAGAMCSFLPFAGKSVFGFHIFDVAPDVGVLFGFALAAAIWTFTPLKNMRQLILVPIIAVSVWMAAYRGMAILPNYSLGVSFVNWEELATAKVEPEILSQLRRNYDTASTASKIYEFVTGGFEWAVLGVFFCLCLAIGLRFVLRAPYDIVDIGYSIGFGAAAAVAFVAAIYLLPETTIELYGRSLDYESHVVLWSSTGMILGFAAWSASAAASIGHWLARNAD